MIEEVKQIFDDIRDAIIEMGGSIGECTSPDEYAEAIKNLQGNNAVLYIPVFQSAAAKPAKPTKQMSSNNPTDYPDGGGTTDGLVDNIGMTYTIVGPDNVYSDGTEPIKVNFEGIEDEKPVTRTFMICLELPPDKTMVPSRPVGGTGIVDGINNYLQGPITSTLPDGSTTSDGSTDNVHSDGSFTGMSTGTFLSEDGSQLGDGSIPICINSAQDGKDGKPGRNGVDGSDQEFIYKVFHTKYDAEMAETPYSDPNQDDYVPGPNPNVKGYWCDRPQGIDHDVYPYEVMCSRQKNVTDGTGGPFTHPVLWSAGGEDGMDGDGVEYIFRVATNAEVVEDNNGVYHLVDMGTWPPTCADDCANGYYTVAEQSGYTREELYEIYQQDEWVPGDNATAQELGWDRNGTDDPRDVDVNEPFEFVSIRKEKVNPETGVHEGGGFSSPVLWNKYYVTDAPIFTSFVFCRSTKNLSNMQLSGGTVVNPFPDDQTVDGELIHWYDSVPGPNQYPTEPIRANAPIGMTSSKFGSVDPQEVIVANWQSPRLMTDNKYFNVEYSNSEEIIDPQTGAPKTLPKFDATIAGVVPSRNQPFIDPTDPEGVDETAGRTYCRSHNFGDGSDDVAYPKYMATCSFNDGAWSDGTVTQIRGENSIMVDFTNDRDELLYHEDGTKVSKRDATTYAKLYDGVEEVVNPTGAIDINTTTGVTVANGGAPYTTLPSPLSANTAYLRTDGYVVVTGINANATQANVVVKTLIDGVAYSKTFVVVKNVGGNNYYLDFSPGAIVYNTTSGNATDKIPINVDVKCECQPDGEIKQLPLPTGYSVGIGDDGTLGTSGTDLTHTCNWPVESGKGVKDTTGTIHIKLSKTRNSPIADTLDGPEDIPVSFVEDGGETEYRYQGNQSATTPPTFTPSGGSNPGSGWSTTVPNRPGDGYFLWCISALKNANGTYGTGGNAVRLTGDTGTPGEDGDDTEWIYKYDTSGGNNKTSGTIPDPNNPGQRIPSSEFNTEDWVPTGGSDNPSGVSVTNKTEYASGRSVTHNGQSTTYSDFHTPITGSHYGERGVDGDGIEYVFIRSKSSTPPTVSSASTDHNGNTYTSDEYLPKASGQQLEQGSYNYECTDEPQGVSSTWLYEGVATRSKAAANSEGVRAWNQYTGTMSLWANFAKNGEDGKDREGVYKRQNTDPGTPPSSGNGEISPPSNRAANGNVAYNNTKDDWVPNGWGDNPQGVTDSATTEWASGRDYDKTNKVGKAFNPSFIGSHYGEQGTDGDGIEYVYIRTNSATPPTITNSSDTYGGKTYLSDDYLPLSSAGRCTDNPTGVASTAQYEYVATRSKTAPNSEGKRTWTKYTENAAMKLGAKGGENGDDGKNQATVSLYQAGTTAPAVPSATTTYTFSTAVLSGALENGSQTMPTVSGDNVCGVTQANAVSENATVSIPSTSGSTPRQISGQKGAPGAQGAAGAKMRMRDGNTSYDGYQGASGEEGYDIAVYPASNDPSLQNIASNLDRLYRCKQTIMHGSIPSGGTPETLTAYFEKATGFSFVATDLMLARKINANEIESQTITTESLRTELHSTPTDYTKDGMILAQGAQFEVYDSNNSKRVGIHPGELQLTAGSGAVTPIVTAPVAFTQTSFVPWTGEGDGFTFTVTETPSSTNHVYVTSTATQQIDLNFKFIPNDNGSFSGEQITLISNLETKAKLYKLVSGSGQYQSSIQPYQGIAMNPITLTGSFQSGVEYSAPTTYVYVPTNNQLDVPSNGEYKIAIALQFNFPSSLESVVMSPTMNLYQYPSGFNQIYKQLSTSTATTCTEIANNGLQVILDGSNYFKILPIRSNDQDKSLEIEFICKEISGSNQGGLRISPRADSGKPQGISYYDQATQSGRNLTTP